MGRFLKFENERVFSLKLKEKKGCVALNFFRFVPDTLSLLRQMKRAVPDTENDVSEVRGSSEKQARIERASVRPWAVNFSVGAYGNRGKKRENEDEFTIIDFLELPNSKDYWYFYCDTEKKFNFTAFAYLEQHLTRGKPLCSRASFFGIFDGHGGKNAAEYCKSNLANTVAALITDPKENESARKALVEGFKTTDDSFLVEAKKVNQNLHLEFYCLQNDWKDGCTAGTILLLGDVMFVGWVGDSRIVLCRKSEDQVCC